jgi:hypothetical protein
MTRGIRGSRWDPDKYVREQHPDVRVIDACMSGRVLGGVDHEDRTIWLNKGLSPAARRSTLAYEIAHLRQGPTPADARLAAAHQRDAAEWAARMLIDSDDFVAAFGVACDYREVAAMLDVDVPTVRARLRGLTDGEQDDVFAAILRLRLTA